MTTQQVDLLKQSINEHGFDKTVQSILSKNKSHVELIVFLLKHYRGNILGKIDLSLLRDKKLALLFVRRDSSSFFVLPPDLQSDKDIGLEMMKSFIREEKEVGEVEVFLDRYFSKDSLGDDLYSFYFEYLKKVQGFCFDDLVKGVLVIKRQSPELYKKLFDLNIIEWSGKKIVFTGDFEKKFLEDIIENESFLAMPSGQQQLFLQDYLKKIFPKSLCMSGENMRFIFDTIFKVCRLRIKCLKKSKKKTTKEDTTKREFHISSEHGKGVEDDGYVGEKEDFCLHHYDYSVSSSGVYNIKISGDRSVRLSQKEVGLFTMVGLQNFIKFYQLLCVTGLDFLWEKCKGQFVTLLNNKVGFGYPDGPGVTESRSLRVLNFIARVIGVIGDGEEAKYDKNFDSLVGVRGVFEEIMGTRTIGGVYYSSSPIMNTSPIELFMREKGFIDKGVLNIEKF